MRRNKTGGRKPFPGDYPPGWKTGEIQRKAYERADWQCEHCGMMFLPGSTKAQTAVNRHGRPIILTIHHLDGNKSNCLWWNLLACCQKCHLHIQAKWKPGLVSPWNPIPQWMIDRNLTYMEQGRLW